MQNAGNRCATLGVLLLLLLLLMFLMPLLHLQHKIPCSSEILPCPNPKFFSARHGSYLFRMIIVGLPFLASSQRGSSNLWIALEKNIK